MIQLSVNVNKVATLRNARGGQVPSVLDAVEACLDAGAPGITVHPRADARHISPADVREIAAALARRARRAEFNIEGDPRPDFLSLVLETRPDQCTLVPVLPGEITSQAGWPPDTRSDALSRAIRDLKGAGIRASLFVDPAPESVRWASDVGADRVELYTEPYARACERSPEEGQAAFDGCARAATLAHALGMGVNAGHDLDLENLVLFRALPHLAEVSIGHALISHAVFVGLRQSVGDYLRLLAG